MKALALASLMVSQLALTSTASAESEPTRAPVSENTALALSVGATAASWAAFVGGLATDQPALSVAGAAGVVLAPSAGHWYAHKIVTRGLVIRAAAPVVFVLGTRALAGDSGTIEAGIAAVLLAGIASSTLLVAGTLDDLGRVRGSARAYNRRHQVSATIVPTANAHGGGLSLVGSF